MNAQGLVAALLAGGYRAVPSSAPWIGSRDDAAATYTDASGDNVIGIIGNGDDSDAVFAYQKNILGEYGMVAWFSTLLDANKVIAALRGIGVLPKE